MKSFITAIRRCGTGAQPLCILLRHVSNQSVTNSLLKKGWQWDLKNMVRGTPIGSENRCPIFEEWGPIKAKRCLHQLTSVIYFFQNCDLD